MKRYLFLKLGLTILVFAAATPRSQVSENYPVHRESRRVNNNHQNNQNVEQTTIPSNHRGDTSSSVPDYQGVMGKPGVDFPVLKFIPRTKFTCRGKKSGYYADLETNCQVFHICDEGRKVSFLCPNGTIFQQSDLICDWWFKVDCAISPTLYEESAEQFQEENNRRKENRKVFQQQQERRLNNKINNNNDNNNNNRASTEFPKTRKIFSNPRNQQFNSFTKKDINQFTSNSHNNNNNNNRYQDETQIPSETASFVNNRYNSDQQQKYFKNLNINDVRQDSQTLLPPKSYVSGDFTPPVKTSTEKINNQRGGRNFNNKLQFRNQQITEQVKTTTQHTIYSPTVPPFTSTRLTTKQPAGFTTASTFTTKIVTNGKLVPANGFYITKDPNEVSTNSPFYEFTTLGGPVYTSTSQKIFTNPRSVYTPSPFTATTTEDPNTPETLHTTPAAVSKPLVGSEIITGSNSVQQVDSRFGTANNTVETTTENSNANRNSKQINFSTISPYENQSIRNTIPSIPTPFRTREEILKDSSSTNRFNQFTYLPNSTAEPKIPTPKPTIPTDYTTYTTLPTVTDNLHNMIKTLEEIEGENPLLDSDKQSNSRPGLHIPPSAGPKTLHSLAIYFATALDNLVTANGTNNSTTEKSFTTESETHVTLLSRMTQDKYNSLFDEAENQTGNNSPTEPLHHDTTDISVHSLIEHDSQLNDLDGQQSRGPVSSSTPRIRQLAQVFTQALSAYLDDPDTFKKVLEEIRPTEPPFLKEDTSEETTLPPTITTEYKSYTKEEDEVLDFSDADKSSTYKPFIDNNIKTTQASLFVRSGIPSSTPKSYFNEISTHLPLEENSINSSLSKRIPTPNPVALNLNNELKLSTPSGLQDIDETSVEGITESDDYFPFNTGEDEEDARKKATAKPYGAGVKPLNSTPITPRLPTDSLLPPFKVSLIHKTEEINSSYITNEEYLQSAHSQSFLAHKNNKIGSERDGKSIKFNSTNNYYPTTTDFATTTSNPFDFFTSTLQPTTYYDSETTRLFTSRSRVEETTIGFYPTTDYPNTEPPTTYYSTYSEATTIPTDQTTISRAIPNDHWSTSPEVTKLWETTLYVDPQIINRNLGFNDTNEPTTYRPDFPTQPIRTTTEYPTDSEEIDLKFSSTTDISIDSLLSTLPSTTEPNDVFTTVIDLGIHTLLNSTEHEIATSQAQQIFGNLNATEQDILIEKMKEAESNSTVRRLILLLVSTCDASLSNNKTVQQTRNSIIHALLNMPSTNSQTKNYEHNLSSRSGKQLTLKTKTEKPVTRTTTTTTTPETTSTPGKPSRKNSIRSTIEATSKTVEVKDVHQDTRALELLRSLYSLAAKWGKK